MGCAVRWVVRPGDRCGNRDSGAGWTPAFFSGTLVAAAVSAALAVTFVQLGLGHNLDAITIGAFMSLTPGVALTNSMREFMAGDMVSGVSRLTEALLIATAIALSTGVVLALSGTAL